ncbi:MAG: energy transducer TonB [Lysobacteraceae bacterium]|nr:energy transducer TonB [Xanthomonadaceae bacterium]HRY00074.1 energy transducer TonB [Xanthomonadaceae bacterium]
MNAAPRTGPGDRLGATIAFSLIAHGVLALGIGFSREDAAPVAPTLDVILARTQTENAPDQADYLSQHNQTGGGDSDQRDRPSEAQTGPTPLPQQGQAPMEVEASTPRPEPDHSQALVTTTGQSEFSVNDLEKRPTPDLPIPSDREILRQKLEMARLSAEIERKSHQYAKRPKKAFLTANTKAYEYASYLRGWVARVERIGNLNYPDEARRRNLHGEVVMTVEVRRDGTVESVEIIQSSGEPLLDEAAVRIVKLSSPFAPIPENSENVDILNITRTWQFLPGNILRNR